MNQMIANRYEMKSLIGVGGMGQVYAGTDTHTNNLPVAIKLLRVDALLHDPDAVKRFQREGEILRQLDHPNIVDILAVVDDSDQPCIVMELVEGGSLADAIKNSGPLPVERTLGVALELADALARAHHLDIIHRDIKPQNVLLAEDGTPRLTDFGLAQHADMPVLTATHAVVGTLDYLSPEALNGEPCDTRTDIWSFGVMLFEMLAGLRPFRGDTTTATLKSILTEPPMPDLERLRPDIPEPLAALIYTMLEKERARRVDSMRRVAVYLEDIKNGKSPDVPTSVLAKQQPDGDVHTPRHNLTNAATPFIGREDDIQTIVSELTQPDCRLLTLVGPGGIGKTRLALEVAANMLDEFTEGVFAVELASVHARDDMPAAIGSAIGFQFSSSGGYSQHQSRDANSELLDYLRSKEMLLVLDNLEHLLDGIRLIDAILTSAPQVKVLATSREVLNLNWEWVYTVQGMSIPDDTDVVDIDEYSAIRLFTSCAKRVQPRFSLDTERDDVNQICRLVDGMPLGIELAASWLRMLTCQELVDEISHNLDVLSSRQRTASERHRSLRAVFDHSWSLLSTVEQQTLLQLAVFPAPFRREAARQVADASLAVLSSLVDKSLLRVDVTGWYDLHPLLQQYAVDKLTDECELEEAARERHAQYFLEFVAERAERVRGADSPAACQEINDEFENVRVAFHWASQHGDSQHLEPAIVPMDGFLIYATRAQDVAKFWQSSLETWNGPKNRVYVTLLAIVVNYSRFSTESLDMQKRKRMYQECLNLLSKFEDDPATAYAYMQLAWALMRLDRPQAQSLIQIALRHFERLGQQWGIVLCHSHQARIAGFNGDWQESGYHLEQCLAIALHTGCPYEIADAHRAYAWHLNRIGNFEDALQQIEWSRQIYKTLDEAIWFTHSGMVYGVILSDLGRLEAARSFYEEALPIAMKRGNRHRVSQLHNNLGLLLVKMNEFDEARLHLEAAFVINEEIGESHHTSDSLGELELAASSLKAAQQHFHVALQGGFDHDEVLLQVFMTNQFARLCAKIGDLDRSAELLGFAINHPAADSELHGHADALLEELQAEMDQDVLNAAMERGEQRQLEDVVAELLEDFAP